MEQQLHQVVYHLHHPLLGLVGSPLGIHACNRYGILRTNNPHFLDFLVKLLVRHQISRLGIAQIGILLQLVPLGGQFRQIVLLPIDHLLRALHHRREDGVHCSEYESREEHDAEAQDEGA